MRVAARAWAGWFSVGECVLASLSCDCLATRQLLVRKCRRLRGDSQVLVLCRSRIAYCDAERRASPQRAVRALAGDMIVDAEICVPRSLCGCESLRCRQESSTVAIARRAR